MPLLFGAGFSQVLHEVGNLHAHRTWISCVNCHMQMSLVCQFISNEDGIEVSAADYRKSMQNVRF